MIPFLLIMNLITFGVFGFDKWQAQKHQWRISENTLLLLSILGGILGAASGMILFNHKVSKKSFLMKFILVVLIDLVFFYRLIRH
ncbi:MULTISPECIES: DUF1294 domain-containing protein [unclassified Chryseobacterium]|jgi:uncharacterized membrane protein YsdA (DUF1294 family)|uniref:DUF1294 domain-containing protein n=2 Tax=Chryseobacterium candidae TaxID=1978493 RepID=A0ABY2R259_9FLAO|nr:MULTISPECIES: DUF1294 domain-containing protein [unclassified Chryseobacterium]THV56397.1 DUF1294 domain-containing protein [Chryseobacterium candidae]SIR51079.1 Uncharacterized membrane protein YsdA, DUF1294 family [Chryseobacterium sp. RU33C]